MKQFVLPEHYTGEDHVSLRGETFHHLARVRRIHAGDTLKGIGEDHRRYTFRVESVRKDACTLVKMSSEEPRTKTHHVTLFQSLLKGKKFDQVIRQATEAGADRIVPVAGEYAVPRPEDKEGKLHRLKKIVREAVEQSGAPHIPEITHPVDIDDIDGLWNRRGTAIYCSSIPGKTRHLHELLASARSNIAIFIGPEGGLSDTDITTLENAGFLPLSLGEHILRSETAAVYALGAVSILLMENETWTLKNR